MPGGSGPRTTDGTVVYAGRLHHIRRVAGGCQRHRQRCLGARIDSGANSPGATRVLTSRLGRRPIEWVRRKASETSCLDVSADNDANAYRSVRWRSGAGELWTAGYSTSWPAKQLTRCPESVYVLAPPQNPLEANPPDISFGVLWSPA